MTPPGTLVQLNLTIVPSLPSPMAVYSIRSPVAGSRGGPESGGGAMTLRHSQVAWGLTWLRPVWGRRPGEIVESCDRGAEEENAGGDAGGGGERGARHGGDKHHRSDR
jgi:hypothetical protein